MRFEVIRPDLESTSLAAGAGPRGSGLGFCVFDLGYRVWGLRFGVDGSGLRVRPDLMEKGFQFKTCMTMKFTTQHDRY